MRPILVILPLALVACAPEEPQLTTVEAGRLAFVENCAVCHGADAKGTGPLAADLDPRPADLTRISARHGGTFPRDHVMSTINGYGSDGDRPMPHFPVEQLGELVQIENPNGTTTPTPEHLLELADYLESIQE